MKLASVLTVTILLLSSTQLFAQELKQAEPVRHHLKFKMKDSKAIHCRPNCRCGKKTEQSSQTRHGAHAGHNMKHCQRHLQKHHNGNACDCICEKESKPIRERSALNQRDKVEKVHLLK